MKILVMIAYLVGGACVTNSVPHLVSGLTGRSFPSPFAKPFGVGLSSPVVNLLWGWANLVFAYVLILHVGAFDVRAIRDVALIAAESLIIGVMLARSFGKSYGTKSSPAV